MTDPTGRTTLDGGAVPVDVRWIDVRDAASPFGLLADAERRRIDDLVRPADRVRSALGTVLARLVVARLLDRPAADVELRRRCPFCGSTAHGPLDVRGPADVSVSHDGDIVIVAASRSGRIGVDIQRVASRVEPGLLQGDGEPGAFAAAWAQREAVTKAVRAGLAVPLDTVRIGGDGRWWPSAEERPSLPRPPERFVEVRPIDPVPGYRAAVAVLDASPEVRIRSGTSLLASG